MSTTVVLASPIVKIFNPKWAKICAEKPDLIMDPETSFQVMIPTSTGGIGPFTFMEPVDINDLPALRKWRKEESGTPRADIIMNWLCSVASAEAHHHETDQYGIVKAHHAGADITHLVMQKHMLERKIKEQTAKKEGGNKETIQIALSRIQDIDESLEKAATDTTQLAVELANKRVMRHVNAVWDRIKREWVRLRENKQEKLTPSFTEICIMHVLKSQIQQENALREKMEQQVNELSSSLGVRF